MATIMVGWMVIALVLYYLRPRQSARTDEKASLRPLPVRHLISHLSLFTTDTVHMVVYLYFSCSIVYLYPLNDQQPFLAQGSPDDRNPPPAL